MAGGAGQANLAGLARLALGKIRAFFQTYNVKAKCPAIWAKSFVNGLFCEGYIPYGRVTLQKRPFW